MAVQRIIPQSQWTTNGMAAVIRIAPRGASLSTRAFNVVVDAGQRVGTGELLGTIVNDPSRTAFSFLACRSLCDRLMAGWLFESMPSFFQTPDSFSLILDDSSLF